MKFKEEAVKFKEDWQPSPSWGKFNNVSKLFDPMAAAFKIVRAFDDLSVIAATMKPWDGVGRSDELQALDLSHYFHRDLHAKRKSKAKRDGPPRWRSC